MSKRFTIEAAFHAIDGFSSPVRKMQARFASMTKGLASGVKKVNDAADKTFGGLKRVGMALGAAGIAGGFAAANFAKSGIEFEQAMADVGAVAGATAEEMKQMSSAAQALASTSKFTGGEVARAMESMAKAGFSTSEILKGLPGLLSAAAADGGELESVSAGIMASIKSMGLGADKIQEFADAAAKAGDLTAASIGSITEGFATVGPVARQLDIPFRSVIGQLALLQDAGLDASSAATSLAATYSKLAAPAGKTKKALAQLGISVADTAGNMKQPAQLFSEILTATNKIKGNVGQTAAMSNLVGLESQKALLNIAAAAGTGKLREMEDALADSLGYSKEIAKLRLSSFSGDWTMLGSAVTAFKDSLFETQSGPLRGVVQGMTDWVNANKDFAKSKFVEYVDKAIPLVELFVGGVRAAGREAAWVVSPLQGAARWIDGMFGDGAPGKQAFLLGKNIARVTIAIVGFTATAKTAAAVTFTLGAISKATAAVTFVFSGVLRGLRAALLFCALASKEGVRAAIAMSFASKLATAASIRNTAVTWARTSAQATNTAVTWAGTKASVFFAKALFGQRAAALAAAGGMKVAIAGAIALAAAAAAAAAALYAAYSQNEKLKKESGGLGFFDIAGKMWDEGTWDPFKVVDKHMNEQAKAARSQEGQAVKTVQQPAAAVAAFDDMFTEQDALRGYSGFDPTTLRELGSAADQFGSSMGGLDLSTLTADMGDLTKQVEGLTNGLSSLGVPATDLFQMPDMESMMREFDPDNFMKGISEVNLGSPTVILPDSMKSIKDSMEITIRDESGRAEVTGKPKKGSAHVEQAPSGAY